MSTEIVKYKELYKIIFKDDETKVISAEMCKKIQGDLQKNSWIVIDDEIYNPFEIKKIVKFKMQDWINERLKVENESVQKQVRGFIKVYKNDVTLWVLENMIKKAKWIEI